jgi:UDP-arabinose 4-epimerase
VVIVLPSRTSILVTGGAGYIGSHACKALFRAGYNPISFDNLIYGHERAVKWGELIRGDLTNPECIQAVIRNYRPEAILHFAAYAYVGESVIEPSKYYHNNLIGSYNLLEAARVEGIDKIVFSSTCATYGVPNPKDVPICEQHVQLPVNPYGATKLAVERMLEDYGCAYGIRSIILRYFNAAGADPDGKIGEVHSPETHLIPLLLDAAAGYSPHVTIFGNDYATSDGTCIRDYVHVSDLADAHVLALKSLMDGCACDKFNLGYGNGSSVMEVVQTVSRVTGRNVPIVIGQRRDGDPPLLVSSTAKARNVLGWAPCYDDLETIIRHSWQWHQSGIFTER